MGRSTTLTVIFLAKHGTKKKFTWILSLEIIAPTQELTTSSRNGFLSSAGPSNLLVFSSWWSTLAVGSPRRSPVSSQQFFWSSNRINNRKVSKLLKVQWVFRHVVLVLSLKFYPFYLRTVHIFFGVSLGRTQIVGNTPGFFVEMRFRASKAHR